MHGFKRPFNSARIVVLCNRNGGGGTRPSGMQQGGFETVHELKQKDGDVAAACFSKRIPSAAACTVWFHIIRHLETLHHD